MTVRRSAEEALAEAVYLRGEGLPAQALAAIGDAEELVGESQVALRVRIAIERAILEKLTGSPERALTALNWVLAEANSDRVDALLERSPGLEWNLARGFIIFLDAGLRLTDVHARELLDAVEAGHRFLRRIGREEWRDGLLSMHASILQDMGEMERALPLVREAVEVASESRSGSPGLTVASYRRGLAETLRELERFEEAEGVLQTIIDSKESSVLDRLGAHVALGHVALQLDVPERAVLHGLRASDLASGMFDKQRAIVQGLLVDAYRATGDRELASRAATRGMQLASRSEVPSLVCGATQDLIDVLLDEGDLDAAADHLVRGEELAARLDARTDRTVNADLMKERRSRLERLRSGEES